jgi:hypothetical protein
LSILAIVIERFLAIEAGPAVIRTKPWYLVIYLDNILTKSIYCATMHKVRQLRALTGQVVYRHYGHSMADIPNNDELLSLLDRLNQNEEVI